MLRFNAGPSDPCRRSGFSGIGRMDGPYGRKEQSDGPEHCQPRQRVGAKGSYQMPAARTPTGWGSE